MTTLSYNHTTRSIDCTETHKADAPIGCTR